MIMFSRRFFPPLYVLGAMFVFGIWVWSAETPTTSFNGDPRSKLSELIDGSAYRPYVQRAFVPIVTRALRSLLPSDAVSSFTASILSIPKVQKELVRLGWEKDRLADYLIALGLAFISLTLLPFVLRRLWMRLYDTEPIITNLVPLAILFVLPTIFPTGPHYVYDFPTLLFFSLGLLLLYEHRWNWYYPILAMGLVNKETMALLLLVYIALYWGQDTLKTMLRHVFAQCAVILLVTTIIGRGFSNNPGSSIEFHLYANIHTMLLGYSFMTLITLGGIVWLVSYDFREKPKTLRRSALVLIPSFLLVLFFFGVLVELRDIYELVPLIGFLILHTILFSFCRLPVRLKIDDVLRS